MMAATNKTHRVLTVLCIGILCLNVLARAGQGPARKVSYTIDPTRVLNRIDPKVYGHFFEHIYHSANGGLWGEQVWNRSFEENTAGRWRIDNGVIIQSGMGTDQRLIMGAFGAKHWDMFGPGTAEVTSDHPFNSHYCVRIKGNGGQTGLEQNRFHISAGETYAGSLWARGAAAEGLTVRLIKGRETLAEQRLETPGPRWRELKFQLQPRVSDANAILQVSVRGQADVVIDQVSMMPRAWKNAGGFRPDLLQAVAALQPPVIRWPGGCFASPYRWKDGIGPQAVRRVTRRELWDDRDINSLGTDEFIALCRKVGAEPLIVVNIGTPQWNADADTHDFLQDALDWIEYCNGPSDSKWGRVRAANGHPEPYGVRYWEIDNETWGMGVENYIEAVKRFAPAMRAADPSVKLAACGSGGFNLNWNRRIIEGCAELIDYLSIHHYENPDRFAQGPYAYERFIQQTGEIIATSRNPRLKIDCSEWNAQTTDWRTGLYAGGVLNAFERCGDIFEIGGPALFLRHVSARAWDNAFINFDQSAWFPAPNYVVMQLWRRHYAPERIALAGGSEVLNTIATKSRDGRTLYVKCVNPEPSVAEVSLNLTAGRIPLSVSLERVAPGSLAVRNTLDRPHAIHTEPGAVHLEKGTMKFTLPALSAGVVTIEF